MPGAHFNPPPNWPVPHDWTPLPDWAPDPSWPAAPAGWQFFTDTSQAGTPQALPYPVLSPPVPKPPAPASGRQTGGRRTGLLIGALAVVVALVIGGVVSVVWWIRSPDGGSRPEYMLAQTFPTQPVYAWSVQANSLGAGTDPGFATPVFGHPLYAYPNAIVAAGRVIIQVAPDRLAETGVQLVSLNLEDGSTQWSVPINRIGGCARDVIGDLLPCVGEPPATGRGELQFIDVTTGEIASTAEVPFDLLMVATHGGHLYTAGYRAGTALVVAKGSPQDPLSGWESSVAGDMCSAGGDTMDLRIRDGVVTSFLGGGDAALRDSDGSSLFAAPVSQVRVTHGHTVYGHDCRTDTQTDMSRTLVIDTEGDDRFSIPIALRHPRIVVADGDVPLVGYDGAGIDPVTGDVLWRQDRLAADPGASSWIVGSALVTTSTEGVAAFDLRSGEQLWQQVPTTSAQFGVTDGVHLIVGNDGGGVEAVTIADGSRAWSTGFGFSDAPPALHATEDGIVWVTRDSVGLLRPTGGAASVPSAVAPVPPPQ